MATEILMPRQGQSVESCIITGWKVKEGDTVAEGQALCEVETDKATFEVPALAAGTVLGIFYADGADVPVLKVIAAIGAPGEDISGLRPEEPQNIEQKISKEEVKKETSAAPCSTFNIQRSGEAGVSPRAKNLAKAKGLDLSGLAGNGSGPEGRVIERDVKAALEGKAVLSPAAKAKAAAGGLVAPSVGSGIGGRVLAADLSEVAPKDISAALKALDFPGEIKEIAVKGVRKVVAGRMLASLQNTAQLTLNSSADARTMLDFRARCKAAPESAGVDGITLNDVVLFATARTLLDFPELNAHWLVSKMVQFSDVHLGFAVDTPRGLMVPVIRFANRLTLKQISAEAKRLGSACIKGMIEPDELKGGTFTVTNLGAMGIDSFTPVLNAPEVGILGVCSIQPKPVMKKDGGVEFIPHIGLSLTFDHCAADGAPAAKFMVALRQNLAAFDVLLVR
ncbi:MAG: dihydrolipoamide acetyltransferase family protein [Kiritimatiellales bacterium]|jgi:pyruvate dehydrogenase E2 component (dihydrolipoamide acetyltransferase)